MPRPPTSSDALVTIQWPVNKDSPARTPRATHAQNRAKDLLRGPTDDAALMFRPTGCRSIKLMSGMRPRPKAASVPMSRQRAYSRDTMPSGREAAGLPARASRRSPTPTGPSSPPEADHHRVKGLDGTLRRGCPRGRGPRPKSSRLGTTRPGIQSSRHHFTHPCELTQSSIWQLWELGRHDGTGLAEIRPASGGIRGWSSKRT
jgi:hypothetical protein